MARENSHNNGAKLGFERELWRSADALRSNMDAAEYKHVVLGLIFLKFISDAFEEQYARLVAELHRQQQESSRLDKLIWANLEDIGYGE